MSNANDLLLFIGGGEPYPEATHWITVAKGTAGSATDSIGFADYDAGDGASGHFGGFSPRLVYGVTVSAFYANTYSDGPSTGLFAPDGTTAVPAEWANKGFSITRLDTMEKKEFTYDTSLKIYTSHTCASLFFSSSDVGKTIPLKIEAFSV